MFTKTKQKRLNPYDDLKCHNCCSIILFQPVFFPKATKTKKKREIHRVTAYD